MIGATLLTLSGQPQGVSRRGFLSVTAAGESVVSYRYKIAAGDLIDCGDASGYSASQPIGTLISDIIAALPDGPVTICAVGQHSSGKWQSFSSATQASWVKDMTPVVSPYKADYAKWNDHYLEDTEKPILHGGEQKWVPTGMPSCEGLSMADELGGFYWRCTVADGEAGFLSELKDDMGLQELITPGSPNGTWKNNKVTVSGIPGGDRVSASTQWWSNTIKPLPDSSAAPLVIGASEQGTIFTQTSNMNSQGIQIDTDSVAIVIFSNSTVTSTIPAINCGGSRCLLYADNQNGVWIEGGRWDGVSGATTDYVHNESGQGVQIRRLSTYSGDYGVQLGGLGIPTYGRIISVNIANAGGAGLGGFRTDHMVLAAELRAVRVANTTAGRGMYLSGRVFADGLYSHNNAGEGIQEWSLNSGSVLSNVAVAGNSGQGYVVASGSLYGKYLNLFSANNSGWGIQWWGAPASSTFLGLTTINNGSNGLHVNSLSSEFNETSQLVSTGNGGIGISMAAGWNNHHFSGNMILGSNAGGNCSIAGTGNNIATGANNSTCSPSGGLNEANFALSLPSTTFIGKATSDSVNTSGGGTGTAAYATTIDWSGFDHLFRSWGIDNAAAYPAAAFRGRCSAGTCRIFDFGLSLADAVLLGRSGNGTTLNSPFVPGSACPTEVGGDRTVTSVSEGETYLIHAVEILSGAYKSLAGDHDGFCETGETCLYQPNFGIYQGHGSLEKCTFQPNGGLQNITLYGFTLNGR